MHSLNKATAGAGKMCRRGMLVAKWTGFDTRIRADVKKRRVEEFRLRPKISEGPLNRIYAL